MTPPLPDVLAQILATKRDEVAAARAAVPVEVLASRARALAAPRPFAVALRRGPYDEMRVLAEIKRASPSAGPIRPGADPAEVARDYAAHGAAALSVLTDRSYFDGDLSFLARARAACDLPLLRKDFLIDPYQVVEARAAGADAVLLIAMALDDDTLRALLEEAAAWQLDALVEVHDEAEAQRALAAGARLLGVNHRDLRTFTIDASLTERLAPQLPPEVTLVAESGIRTPQDVARLRAAGAHAILVGEALMRAPSPGAALTELRGGRRATPVKICGVTTPDDAAAAAAAGAAYVGINQWSRSRRYVAPERVALLAAAARAARPSVQIVGLFVDAYIDEIEAVAGALDVIQLHGDEGPELLRDVRRRVGRPLWKAVPIGTGADVAGLAWLADSGLVDAIVLDAPSEGRGGSGQRIDLGLARAAICAYPRARFVLAGGLTPDNVAQAIGDLAPWAVDVASGVEVAAGLKDHDRMRAFIAAAGVPRPSVLPVAAEPVDLDP